jgi:hypothetical protein
MGQFDCRAVPSAGASPADFFREAESAATRAPGPWREAYIRDLIRWTRFTNSSH